MLRQNVAIKLSNDKMVIPRLHNQSEEKKVTESVSQNIILMAANFKFRLFNYTKTQQSAGYTYSNLILLKFIKRIFLIAIFLLEIDFPGEHSFFKKCHMEEFFHATLTSTDV